MHFSQRVKGHRSYYELGNPGIAPAGPYSLKALFRNSLQTKDLHSQGQKNLEALDSTLCRKVPAQQLGFVARREFKAALFAESGVLILSCDSTVQGMGPESMDP